MRLVFAAGIWVEVTPQFGAQAGNRYPTLKILFCVPSSLVTGQFQGLWGNMNGDASDDFVFSSDNLQPIPAGSSTQDDYFHWGQTCEYYNN